MKVLDLFSGIGAFSLGLERAGMKTVAFCESDENCRKVLGKHWPNVPVIDDVRNLRMEGQVDVICGGFPCQDISVAGKRKGIKGEKSGLWKEFARLIKEARPRYAIIENVANLRSNGLKEVIQDLWKIGYMGEWHIISARGVGAPHLRERIWIIAYPHSNNLWEQSRRRSGPEGKGEGVAGNHGQEGEPGNSAHPHHFRLWKPQAAKKETPRGWSEARTGGNYWAETESPVCGVDDGTSEGLDKDRKERIKQLGNSLVPQIPELIGRAIMGYEKKRELD